MKGYVNPKKVGQRLLISMLAFNVSFAVAMEPAVSAELEQSRSAEMKASSSPAVVEGNDGKTAGTGEGATAIRVYRDPATGKIGEPPAGAPPAEVPPPLRDALTTSSEGLVETTSPTPGGGVIVDLKGRFLTPLIVTRDADGKLSIQHLSEVPGSAEKE